MWPPAEAQTCWGKPLTYHGSCLMDDRTASKELVIVDLTPLKSKFSVVTGPLVTVFQFFDLMLMVVRDIRDHGRMSSPDRCDENQNKQLLYLQLSVPGVLRVPI